MPPAESLERRWDLSDIFADDAAWERERRALLNEIPRLAELRGTLDDGPAALLAALRLAFSIQERADRLQTYAGLRADEDLRDDKAQAMRQTIESLGADLAAAVAWIDPEVLSLPAGTVTRFLDEEPDLDPFHRYLERLEKRRAHTLDPAREHLMGRARLIRGDGATVSSLLHNADIPWPTVTLSNGRRLRLDASGYAKGRTLPNRDDRKTVFESFFATLQTYKSSLAATLNLTIKEHVFEAKVRRFPSCLDASLSGTEVDPSVYRMLVHEVRDSLPALHRYLALRARALDLDAPAYHDVYAPLAAEVSDTYPWETARDLVLESLAPLGDAYVETLRHALSSRWVDIDPRQGKRSGAYVNDGAFGVHPYMLLNHIDDFHGASTVAHESGHLMHSWLSQNTQPYPTARYVIFVAEVASTLNEQLLFHHLYERADDPHQRLALLGHYLETMRGTLFRQSMFAEFELDIHETVERGGALTSDSLAERYIELLRRFHGQDEGVMSIDARYGVEWAYVPHFHYDFYVYQYATSYVAAVALASRIREGDADALERYLAFLSSGSTQPPVELLKDAGVDMTSPEPIRQTVHEMHRVMDEVESILPAVEPVARAGRPRR